MKVMFTQDVLLGNIKTKGRNLTTEVSCIKKGDVFNVTRAAAIGHDRRQYLIAMPHIEWEKDGWQHSATLGTSHYPHTMFEMIPETPLERSFTK